MKKVEGLFRPETCINRNDVAVHHVLNLREAVEARSIVLGEDADRLVPRVDNDDCAVGTFVNQAERVADRIGRRKGDGRLVNRVPGLHEPRHRLDDVEGDVLWKNRNTAAACDGFGHPATRNRGHVGHHDRHRRADGIGCGEVDVESARHLAEARHHEDVAVRQVVGRLPIEETHGCLRLGE